MFIINTLSPMKKKILVYVAGKLNSNAVGYIKNIHSMIKEGEKLRKEGLYVYIPANDFLEGVVCGNFEYKDYFDNSQVMLERSDAVYVCPNWESSDGTKKEIELAVSLNIPVFYEIYLLLRHFDIDDGLPF